MKSSTCFPEDLSIFNDVIGRITSHKSIRAYKKRHVDDELLKKLVEIAARASSSGNMQCFSVIATRDKQLKEKLYRAHFCQSMVLDAPVLLTFCADFHRMRIWLKNSGAPLNFDNFMSFLIAMIDACLVSQNLALAAESVGLGICYLGTTLANCQEIGKILNLPECVVPVVGFTLGYPDENPIIKDRLPTEGLLHFDQYHDYTAEKIEFIYQQRNKNGETRYRSNPELKQKWDESGVKNLAQFYTRVKYTKESHNNYSDTVLNYLIKQGFFNKSQELH